VRANQRVQEAYLGSSVATQQSGRTDMLLHIENLHAFYGKSHVLHGVQFDVARARSSPLRPQWLGPLHPRQGIMGMVELHGHVAWNGKDDPGRKPYEIAHLGIGYVPENRDIFPSSPCTRT
jgi:branched-chain amino acid transport system ATP-binding protein